MLAEAIRALAEAGTNHQNMYTLQPFCSAQQQAQHAGWSRAHDVSCMYGLF